jgi:uncharacterized protein
MTEPPSEESVLTSKSIKKQKRYSLPGILGLFLFAGCLLYGIVIAILHSDFYDKVVLVPFPAEQPEYKTGAVAAGVKGQDQFFKAEDGSLLHGWYFNKPGNRLTVIFHHGNAANITYRLYIAEYLLNSGINVFLYDYRGYGKSSGVPRVAYLVPDGTTAFDHLTKTLHVDPKTVINYGESIGTGVACQVAAQRPSAGLILQSAIGSLPMMAHKHFDVVRGGNGLLKYCAIPLLVLVPDFLLPDPKLNNVEQIKLVHAPVIIIHGMKDATAPYEHAQIVFANANEPKKFVALPHGSHNDVAEDSQLFKSSVEEFFATTAQATASAKLKNSSSSSR